MYRYLMILLLAFSMFYIVSQCSEKKIETCLCVKSHKVIDSIYETRKGGWHRWTVYEREVCDSFICDTIFKSK